MQGKGAQKPRQIVQFDYARAKTSLAWEIERKPTTQSNPGTIANTSLYISLILLFLPLCFWTLSRRLVFMVFGIILRSRAEAFGRPLYETI